MIESEKIPMKKQQNYTLIFIVKPFIILLCVICFLYFFPVKRAIDISFVPEPITPSLSYGKQVTVLCEPIRNDNMRTPVDSFILVAIQNENGIFEKLPTNIDGTPVLSNGNHVVIVLSKEQSHFIGGGITSDVPPFGNRFIFHGELGPVDRHNDDVDLYSLVYDWWEIEYPIHHPAGPNGRLYEWYLVGTDYIFSREFAIGM